MKEAAFEKGLKELVGFQLAEMEWSRKGKESAQKIRSQKRAFLGNGE